MTVELAIQPKNATTLMPEIQEGVVSEENVKLIQEYYHRAQQVSIPREIIDAYCCSGQVELEVALKQAEETKRFLCIRAAVDGVARDGRFKIGMSGPVDLFWHTFLLYSPAYFDFCEHICGFYVQHYPNPKTMPKTEQVARLINLFDAYEAAFGHEPLKEIWQIDRESIYARLQE